MNSPAPPKKARDRKTLLSFVGLGLAFLLWIVITRPDVEARTSGPGLNPLPVEVTAITWQDTVAVERSFLGRVEARQESALAFEISGAIATVLVEEGETVAAGAPLITLDRARREARRTEVAARVALAESQLRLAQTTFERTERARALDAISVQEWQTAEEAVRSAEADLAGARASLATIDLDLEKSTIAAPYAAIVAARRVDVGAVVSAGEPVLVLYERESPEVRLALSSRVADELRTGETVTVEVRDRTIEATVERRLPELDAMSRSVEAVLRLDTPLESGTEDGGPLLRRGDLARVAVSQEIESRGFWVPITALTEGTRGLWALLTVDAAGAVQRNDVEVLETEEDRAYVRGALPDGARAITTGLQRVAAGMTVRPVDTE